MATSLYGSVGMDTPDTSKVTFTPSDSGERTSSNITRYRRELHENIYTPMLEQAVGQIGQSGIVDRAKERAQTDPGALQARLDRQRARMGGNMSAAAQQYQQGNLQRQSTLRGNFNVNNARIAEDEFDTMGRRSAVNIGNDILSNAQQGAQGAAQIEAGIDAQNEAGRAANNAAWIGTGTAIMASAI